MNAANRVPSAALPPYVIARNEHATACGLIVERCEVVGDKLTTIYSGMEDAWRSCDFCRRPREKPFPRQFSYCDFGAYSPSDDGGWICMRARWIDGGTMRATLRDEPLPEWIESLPGGIIAHSFGSSVAYVGPPDSMVKRGIAPEAILKGETWFRADGIDAWHMGPVIWRAHPLADKQCIFTDYVGVREEEAAKVAERKRQPYATPEDLRAEWGGMVREALTLLERSFRRVETKAGKTYTLDPGSLQQVSDAVDDLVTAIHATRITVRDTDPTATTTKQRASIARNDQAFQGFVSRLGLRNPS